MKTTFAIALMFVAFATGCKPAATESEVESLDNFTREGGQAVQQNSCGYALTEETFHKLSAKDQGALEYVEAPTRALALDALGAMAAVPRPLLSLFYKLDGRVKVVQNVAAACEAVNLSPAQKKFAGEGEAKMDGCWNVSNGKLEVIVRADHASIHHAIVRVFGFVYTQFVTTVDLSKLDLTARAAADNALKRLARQKQQLGDALLVDVARKSGKTSAHFAQFSTGDESAFEDFAVAEAIDSYYCSKATRAVFERDFKNTFKAFTALQLDLGKAWYE